MEMQKATSHKLGPGLLTFGETGSPNEFGGQITEVKIEPKTKDADPLPVLSGDEITGDDEMEWTLSGSGLDRYDKSAMQLWAHLNRGKKVTFTFRPDNGQALAVKGTVKVNPMAIGGKIKERNENEFEFTGVGDYDYVDADSGEVITTFGPIVAGTNDEDW